MSQELIEEIPANIKKFLDKQNIKELRPSQEKSIKKGLFKNNHNQIVCTPTGSGKTLVAELAMLDVILNKQKKVIYIVPLKALASEKYKEFQELYGNKFRIRISIGEVQNEKYNYDYDLLLVTSEKLDSLIRHDRKILENLGLVIVDEIHLLNDEKRGPTLEILLSIFRTKYKKIRIIGLSATIGNAKELSSWLKADLIEDNWRPVELQHYVLYDNELMRYK
ncbi:MAG: DEAD/DEAH box helicase [Nanoarchaeota archaeon]|nr:DEAD/DEAH box helicase [Nanoarchaeota archaeon]MCA9497256.1 DEAD/DEAH box helicase [Nanoarchaeota archaeon]